jgi:hypothetical protein
MDQIQLPVHSKGPRNHDINWFFAAPKFQKTTCSFWKSILGSWLNVRASLVKTELTSQAEVLRQPIFSNPLVTNTAGHPLGVIRLSEGQAITKADYTRIKVLWDLEDREWKRLPIFGMNSHIINRTSKNIIIPSIPWNPVTFPNRF